MISRLRLRFGSAPAAPAEEVVTRPVTVFVGPNNSGKTKILAGLRTYCTSGQLRGDNVILSDADFHTMYSDEVSNLLSSIVRPPAPGQVVPPDRVAIGKGESRHLVPSNALNSALTNPNAHKNQFCQWYLQFHTLMLDGRNRLRLVDPIEAGDLQKEPTTTLQVLFADDHKRNQVRRILHDAFGIYFVIDPTSLGRLRIRFAERTLHDDREERGIHSEAVLFHRSATGVSSLSDGVKAFTAS